MQSYQIVRACFRYYMPQNIMESHTIFALLALLVPHQRHRTLLITIVESLTCVDTDGILNLL